MKPLKQLRNLYNQFGERSRKATINIALSFGARGVTIITQLMIVPMTINYVNPTQYGIWLTLSSIIAWIGFFDLGFGNGMRNKVAESKAKGNIELARQYVSTTYFTIGVIVISLLIFVQAINLFISWPNILKVDAVYTEELRKVFSILTAFFCLNMVVKIFGSLLTADQKPGIVSLIGVVGQIFSLLVIYILTKVSDGSLVSLATFYAGIPTLVMLIVSVISYRYTRYSQYAPRLKYVRKELVKDIMSIGIQFFIIYLCLLVVFQIINLIISRELGPESVTEYNVANRYFNIAYSVIVIILTPFWSAFTDAYHKHDIAWMCKAKRVLELIWLCEVGTVIIMIIIAPWFYKVWIGNSVSVGFELTVGMAFFVLAQSIGAVYMNLINGIGTIRLQLIVYIVFALISWPLMLFACRNFGLVGILAAPTVVYMVQALLGKVQIEKILSGTNKGIWNK